MEGQRNVLWEYKIWQYLYCSPIMANIMDKEHFFCLTKTVMAITQQTVVLVLSLLVVIASCESNYSNCEHDITVLEKALYTPKNIKELKKVFYPPRETPSRFIKVNYTFYGHSCNVTYIWAIGGFLLMQPPKIFQLTSLYFSTPANNLTELAIQLPSECWPLVKPKTSEEDCNCKQKGSILDILTQQLNIYAKFHDPSAVVMDTSLHVQAICDSELKEDYFNQASTKLFMACTLIIPAFFIVIISTIVRSYHEQINRNLSIKQNHANFAALITSGVFVQAVIVGIDSAAIYYVLKKKYEYSNYDVQHTINCYVTLITFGFDTGIGAIMLLCLLYLWCTLCHRENSSKDASRKCRLFCNNCWLECCLPCCLLLFFYGIFGNKKQDKVWDMPSDYNAEGTMAKNQLVVRRTSWVLLIMLVSPLFSIASHGSYILAAWLTEPIKATETALITVAVLVYANLVFRQCYIANAKINLTDIRCWSFGILLYPIWQCIEHFLNCCKTTKNYYSSKRIVDLERAPDELKNLLEDNMKRDRESTLNTQALCIVLGWGLLVVGSLAFTIVAFYEVPFKTLDLATYLLNIFQIFIVVIAALITYKIFMFSEPEIHRFIKKVRKAYEDKTKTEIEYYDDLEAVGTITGNALEALITCLLVI